MLGLIPGPDRVIGVACGQHPADPAGLVVKPHGGRILALGTQVPGMAGIGFHLLLAPQHVARISCDQTSNDREVARLGPACGCGLPGALLDFGHPEKVENQIVARAGVVWMECRAIFVERDRSPAIIEHRGRAIASP